MVHDFCSVEQLKLNSPMKHMEHDARCTVLSSTAFLSYPESLIQKRQYQPRFQPASFIAVRIIHMPGILIHILLESLFTSPRNRYSHAPEYAFQLKILP